MCALCALKPLKACPELVERVRLSRKRMVFKGVKEPQVSRRNQSRRDGTICSPARECREGLHANRVPKGRHNGEFSRKLLSPPARWSEGGVWGIPGGLGLFQPSPFDKLRAGSAGLDLLVCGAQGLTSWAKFSQTCLKWIFQLAKLDST